MFSTLTPSLASWREAHGFGILCIRTPREERFVIVAAADSLEAVREISPWEGTSESEFRARLEQRAALSRSEIDEAVTLARRWATTFEGSGQVFWTPPA